MSRRKYNPQKAAMYAKRMTTADIESYMHELYDIDISDSTISRITDKILPIVKRAVYIALGINMNKKRTVYHPSNPQFNKVCFLFG